MSNKRDYLITNSRVVATILVVIGHCAFSWGGWPWFDINPNKYIWTFVTYIYSFHMPLFMTLSGYTFATAYLEKIDSLLYRKFCFNRFERMIIPLLFIKFVIWNPINIVIGHYQLISSESATELGHLWYLIVLFAISIFVFAMLKISKGRGTELLFLLASAVNIFNGKFPNFGFSIVNSIYIYFAYFYFGIIIHKYKEWILNQKMFVFAIVELCVFIWKTILEVETNSIIALLLGITGSIGWLSICMILGEKFSENFIVKFLDRYSMGIYLFHLPVIYFLLYMIKDSLLPIPYIVILFIVSIGLSCLITKGLNSVKMGFLIGYKNKIWKEV